MSDELVDMVAEKAVEDQGFLEKVSEKITSVILKAVWSTAFVNDLPDSSFLHILPGGKKDSEGKTTPRDLRMFPYKNASGEVDLPHLRNAIARIPQSNRIDDATKSRLQARARKLLGGQKDSSVGFFKDTKGDWWFLGIYSNKFEDRDEEILSEKSHLEYIQWLKDSGFKPVITVLHQPKMPQVFWPVVFDKFEDKPDKLSAIVKGIYKDFGFAEAQRVMYVNGFTVVAAKVFEDKKHIAETLSKESDLGMSHGFIVRDFSDNIVNKYRTFEMSVLKRKRAANFITLSLFAAKEKLGMADSKGFSDDDRQFLAVAYGEEVADSIEQGTKNIEEMLREAGLNFKDFTEDEPVKREEKEIEKAVKPDMMEEEDEEDEEDASKKKEVEEVADEVTVISPELVAEVVKALNLEQLQEVLGGFAQAVKSLQETIEGQAKEIEALKSVTKDIPEMKKSEDERISAQLTPSINWSLLGLGVSKSKENILGEEEKEELQKNAPVGEEDGRKGDAMYEFFLKTATNGSQGK
jgi:hypothetical protein